MKAFILCIVVISAQIFGTFDLRSQLTTYSNTLASQTEYVLAPDSTSSKDATSIEDSSKDLNSYGMPTSSQFNTKYSVTTSSHTLYPVTSVDSTSSLSLQSIPSPTPASTRTHSQSYEYSTSVHSCDLITEWSTSTLSAATETSTSTHLSTVVVYKYANSSMPSSHFASGLTISLSAGTSNSKTKPTISSTEVDESRGVSTSSVTGNCLDKTIETTRTTNKTYVVTTTNYITVTEPVPIWYILPVTDNANTIGTVPNDTDVDGVVPYQKTLWPSKFAGISEYENSHSNHCSLIIPAQMHLAKRSPDISYLTTVNTATNMLNTGTTAYTTHLTMEIPVLLEPTTTSTTVTSINYLSDATDTPIGAKTSQGTTSKEVSTSENTPILMLPSLPNSFRLPFPTIPSQSAPIPSITAVSLPPITLPSIALPTISLPTIDLPPVSLPSPMIPSGVPTDIAPTGSIPSLSLSLPSITFPSLGLPPVTPPTDLPSGVSVVSLPQLTLPPISIPPISLPAMSLPSLTIPSEIPTSIDLSPVTLPSVTLYSMGLPNTDLPKLSLLLLSVPSISVPALSIPSVSLPTLEFGPTTSGNYTCEPLGLTDDVVICSKNSQPKKAPLCILSQMLVFLATAILLL